MDEEWQSGSGWKKSWPPYYRVLDLQPFCSNFLASSWCDFVILKSPEKLLGRALVILFIVSSSLLALSGGMAVQYLRLHRTQKPRIATFASFSPFVSILRREIGTKDENTKYFLQTGWLHVLLCFVDKLSVVGNMWLSGLCLSFLSEIPSYPWVITEGVQVKLS